MAEQFTSAIQRREIPITQLTHDEMRASVGQIVGWSYPKRSVSPFIRAFPRPQQLAIDLWGWIAILMFIAGIALPLVLSSWWWLVLSGVAIAAWRSNRTSMEQFFVENLRDNPEFYDLVSRSQIGDRVKVVLQR